MKSPSDIEAMWMHRCAARLLEIEPRLAGDDADLIASDLRSEARFRRLEPEAAADQFCSEPEVDRTHLRVED